MADNTVISLANVSKVFKRYQRPVDRLKEIIFPGKSNASEFWALRDINLEISKGETVGIIGRNGAGKSTLLQIIAGTLQPTAGNVGVNGRVAALLELGSGFNPEFTGHQNIFFNGRLLGLTQAEIEDRYGQILEFADIGDFIHQPVKTYSSGMFVRLAFAVQANIDANVVIIDEALAVGDVFFRQKCYSRLEQLRSSGASILLVSHSMPDIEQQCERVVLLDNGKQKFIGPAAEATKYYYLLAQNHQKSTTEKENKVKKKPIETPTKDLFNIDSSALISLSDKKQITNNQGRCIAVALYDNDAQPRYSFRQGEIAIFYYAFEVIDIIQVPICGVVIRNDRGVIVHGKNSWQYAGNLLGIGEMPETLNPGDRICCSQEIQLNIKPGDYVFEIGLASMPRSLWERREQKSHMEMASGHIRVCHIYDAGSFTVGIAVKNGAEFLPHYGLADLPGKITLAVERN
ncbi:MAG: ABC transporter ATP-binding protein [Cyanobacteria bacterium P01_H01_bin.26]